MHQLKWLGMKHRTIKHGLTLIYKIIHGFAPNYLRDMDSFTLIIEMHIILTRNSKNNLYLNKNITSKIHRKAFTFYMESI